MNAQEMKDFWKQNFTLQGRIFYPNILKPSVNKNGRATFNVMFAWKTDSNKATMDQLNAFLMKAKTQFHPTIPMQFFVNPIKNYSTYVRQDGKPNALFLKDSYWINASSGAEIQVPVVDKHRQPVVSEAEVYSGRNAAINISFWNIDKEKKGIGVNLNAVMLMDGGEREGGAGSVNVDQIFGGFASDMSIDAGTPPLPNSSNGFI